MTLTKQQARKLILLHQNLLPSRVLTGKQHILDFVYKVGCIQFDPLDIIAMNPHLVLQSRIKNYKPTLLTEMLYKDRVLIDGWDKNMAIYPTNEWPYFSRYRDSAIDTHTWRDKKILDYLPEVRNTIEVKGPVKSSDIEISHVIDWSWAPTKASRAILDLMFFTGELIVFNKDKSRKTYDFAKKHIKNEYLSAPDPNKTQGDYFKWGVKRRIGSMGLMWNKASETWLGIKGLKSKTRNEAFKSLYESKEIVKFNIENISYDFFMREEDMGLIDLLDNKYEEKISFIAPLDNLIWDRKLIKELFDFDYKWEVYTPEKDRKYGYYVLPILMGDSFIGRIEFKNIKKDKTLLVCNLWFEDKFTPAGIENIFKEAIIDFKNFLECKEIIFSNENTTRENIKWLKKIL